MNKQSLPLTLEHSIKDSEATSRSKLLVIGWLDVKYVQFSSFSWHCFNFDVIKECSLVHSNKDSLCNSDFLFSKISGLFFFGGVP